MAAPPAEPLVPLRAAPGRAGVLLDFDGTLAPIVADPAAARPLDGVIDQLGELATRYALVAVISGRPTDFLQAYLPPVVVIRGLYGLQVADAEGARDHPEAGRWRGVIADVAARAEKDGPAGMLVESKGLSLTLHYRTHPGATGAVHEWARAEAARTGLDLRPAKKSIELHPPIAVDKGTTVAELVEPLAAACFIGDDVGDLPAFDALDRFAARGRHAVRVAVTSPEVDPRLVARADLVVDGPAGVLALMESL